MSIETIDNGKIIDALSYITIASKGNERAFRELHRCCEDKEIVICGAGPTLQKYEPIKDAVHIALNRALLYKKVKFDYFFADDWLGIDFFQEELMKYNCKKYFGRYGFALTTKEQTIPQTFGYKCNATWYYTDGPLVMDGSDSKFVVDIDKAPIGNMPNIALSVMQVALFMNPSRIYLVGCDASRGHFIRDKGDDVRLKDEYVATVNSQKTFEKWNILKKFVDCYYPDIEIVSINPVGLKGLFNDIYL